MIPQYFYIEQRTISAFPTTDLTMFSWPCEASIPLLHPCASCCCCWPGLPNVCLLVLVAMHTSSSEVLLLCSATKPDTRNMKIRIHLSGSPWEWHGACNPVFVLCGNAWKPRTRLMKHVSASFLLLSTPPGITPMCSFPSMDLTDMLLLIWAEKAIDAWAAAPSSPFYLSSLASFPRCSFLKKCCILGVYQPILLPAVCRILSLPFFFSPWTIPDQDSPCFVQPNPDHRPLFLPSSNSISIYTLVFCFCFALHPSTNGTLSTSSPHPSLPSKTLSPSSSCPLPVLQPSAKSHPDFPTHSVHKTLSLSLQVPTVDG